MATLEARSVVGLVEVGLREEAGDAGRDDEGDEQGDEEIPILDASNDARIFRITAIHCRFDESYDDSKSGGYRDLSLSVEVSHQISIGLTGLAPCEFATGSATDPGTA